MVSWASTTNTDSSTSGIRNIICEAEVVDNRIALGRYVRKFHHEAGTLGGAIEENISLLHDPEAIVLSSAHQPNLFAYGGVLKKLVLLEALKGSLLKQTNEAKRKVINLFVVIDQEFANDKWICHAELPSVVHDKGILSLSLRLSDSDRRRMVRNVRKPPPLVLSQWKKEVSSWVIGNIRASSNDDPSSAERIPKNALRDSDYYNNFEQLWSLIEDAYSRSESLSDFNAFLLSMLVNNVFGYGTLFARLTEIPGVLENGIKYLITNFDKYSRILENTESILMNNGIRTRVSQNVRKSAPVWLHCQCGSKASVGFLHEGPRLILSGTCVGCGKKLERSLNRADNPDLSQMILDISLRAIPIPLLLTWDLGISCYVTGIGGVGYLIDAAAVSRGLSLPFPVIALWAGSDLYDGIGQRAALNSLNVREAPQIFHLVQELQNDYAMHASRITELIEQRLIRIKKGLPMDDLLRDLFRIKIEQRHLRSQLKQAQRVLGATSLSSCIIDHAVNFGITNLTAEWRKYLEHDGDLVKPVIMNMPLHQGASNIRKHYSNATTVT